MPLINIMLIANAGILIEYNQQQILVDALHEGHRLYPGTPPEAIEKILTGQPPFDHLRALLCTHNHIDHFSARMTLDVMQQYPELPLIADESSAEAIVRLSQTESHPLDRNRIHTIPWYGQEPFQTRIGDFEIRGISFKHEGRRFAEIANIGYLVTVHGKTILFPGDAQIAPDNFESLTQLHGEIDAAVVMFPYISTTRGQNLIREVIKPKHLVVVHWPDPVRDSDHFTENAKRYFEKTKDMLMETTFLEKYLDSVSF